jgi:hypothetical protein
VIGSELEIDLNGDTVFTIVLDFRIALSAVRTATYDAGLDVILLA